MDSFFENLAAILGNLPAHPIAVISLVSIGVSLIGFLFFYREHAAYRVFAFLFIFVGAVGVVSEVVNLEPRLPDENSGNDKPKATSASSNNEPEASNELNELELYSYEITPKDLE